MKTYKITMILIGHTGSRYASAFEVHAENEASAIKMAQSHIGNRECEALSVEVII